MPQPDPPVAERVRQRGEEVGPADAQGRRVGPLHGEPDEAPAVGPEDLDVGHGPGPLSHGVEHAERRQHARPVGPQHDARADLAELGRPLVDGRLGAPLAERERRRQPGDPAADDGDAHQDAFLRGAAFFLAAGFLAGARFFFGLPAFASMSATAWSSVIWSLSWSFGIVAFVFSCLTYGP